MEVPKTHKVYNGAQRCGAVASDIEVVPDTEDEASIPAQSSAQGSTIAVRHAMSDDVSGQSIQVNVVARSCDAVKGKDANEHALVSNDDACAKEQWYDRMRNEVINTEWAPATAPQQRYSSRLSRRFNSEVSGTVCRRRGRGRRPTLVHASRAYSSSGEQRRSFEDLRAELTEELRLQQSILAAQQNKAMEGLRDDMLRIVNEHRQGQPPLAQVGGARVPSTLQTEVRKLGDVSQSTCSSQAAVVQLAQGQRMSVGGSDAIRSQPRGNALVDAVVGPCHEPVGPCSQYELGGPGLPQVMTGGMPSAALTQQYMSRESQVIPGGMPSGIPPRVCLPADAMCQPYVVQGDRMSVRSMGSDDVRGQSCGGASLDVAQVVGPRHEPVGPCSQYELGGPGIPQVTTGGMPLGVPPGVYVTPEVALTQQYGNRESQMIPGGIPSGMPSGIYRTPVDALGHSLVNRQLMTSQLAQTGNSQYSRDLFMSTETPYYTAPSTCVRINTPQWSTEVAPSSSQNPQDLSMGSTVADQSQGNSQSHKSQNGQSSVAQTKGSGRVMKHATFDDEQKVLAYDTDATDSEDKAVATDKKSAKKATSDKSQ